LRWAFAIPLRSLTLILWGSNCPRTRPVNLIHQPHQRQQDGPWGTARLGILPQPLINDSNHLLSAWPGGKRPEPAPPALKEQFGTSQRTPLHTSNPWNRHGRTETTQMAWLKRTNGLVMVPRFRGVSSLGSVVWRFGCCSGCFRIRSGFAFLVRCGVVVGGCGRFLGTRR